MSQPFPDSPFFSGNYAPISFEADAPDLIVRGELPPDGPAAAPASSAKP